MLRRLSLSVLLLVFCALTLGKTFADEVPASSFSKYLPANSMFFMETVDLTKTIENFKKIGMSRMFQDEQIVAFIDALKAIAGGRDLVEAEETMAQVKAYLEKAQTLFKGHAFATVAALEEQNPEIGVMLGVEIVEGKTAEAVEFINSVIQLIKQQPKMDRFTFTAEETEEFEGVTLNIGTISPKFPPVVWAVTDTAFLFALGKAPVKNFITAVKTVPNDSLYNNPAFIKAHNITRCSELFWYADYNALIRTVADFMTMMPPGPIDVSNLLAVMADSFSKLSGGTSVIDDELQEDLVMQLADTSKFKYYERVCAMTCKFESAKLMPKNPLLFACQAVPFDALYDDILQFLPPEVQDTIAMYENQLMFSLRDELIPALGEEVGFYFDLQMIMPEGMFAISVRDQTAITNIIDLLRANFGVAMNEFEFKGVKINTTNIDRFQIGYAFYENFLLIGTMNAIKGAIARTGETGLDSPYYQQMIALGEQKAISGSFFDLGKGFEMLYSLGMPYLTNYLAANPEFDPTVVPTADVFTQYLTPFISASFCQDKAVIGRIKGPLPFGSIVGMYMMIGSVVTQYIKINGPNAFAGEGRGDVF